jgi:hypothetical protein
MINLWFGGGQGGCQDRCSSRKRTGYAIRRKFRAFGIGAALLASAVRLSAKRSHRSFSDKGNASSAFGKTIPDGVGVNDAIRLELGCRGSVHCKK